MLFPRLKQRVLCKLERYGEDVVIGGNTIKAFLQPLDSSRTHTYLDDTEAQAVIKPGLFLIASGDAVININETLERDGRIYTVRKVAVERLLGTPVVKFAVLC